MNQHVVLFHLAPASAGCELGRSGAPACQKPYDSYNQFMRLTRLTVMLTYVNQFITVTILQVNPLTLLQSNHTFYFVPKTTQRRRSTCWTSSASPSSIEPLRPGTGSVVPRTLPSVCTWCCESVANVDVGPWRCETQWKHHGLVCLTKRLLLLLFT